MPHSLLINVSADMRLCCVPSIRTGKIDYHELKVAMRSLGFDVKKPEVLMIMAAHGLDERGYVVYDEFVDIMAERMAARSPEEELSKAFELFDEDGKGKISLRNLRHIAKELGENLSDDELQAMIDEFDGDQDGEISLDEFRGIMASTTLYE